MRSASVTTAGARLDSVLTVVLEAAVVIGIAGALQRSVKQQLASQLSSTSTLKSAGKKLGASSQFKDWQVLSGTHSPAATAPEKKVLELTGITVQVQNCNTK